MYGVSALVTAQWSRLHLQGAAKAGNPPVTAGLASPTLPTELAWRHHGGEEMGGGGCVFIPPE